MLLEVMVLVGKKDAPVSFFSRRFYKSTTDGVFNLRALLEDNIMEDTRRSYKRVTAIS